MQCEYIEYCGNMVEAYIYFDFNNRPPYKKKMCMSHIVVIIGEYLTGEMPFDALGIEKI